MATTFKTGRLLVRTACPTILFAIVCALVSAQRPQAVPITITLVGQSMIRSDIRATAPGADTGDPGVAEGRCGVHQQLERGRRKRARQSTRVGDFSLLLKRSMR